MLVELYQLVLQICFKTGELIMKNSKLNIFAASMIVGSVLLSGQVLADKGDKSKQRPDRQMIKVKAKEGSDIKVMVGVNGEKNKYTFTNDELTNMDNVAAKLSDLDEATSVKVLTLLGQLREHDDKTVELKTVTTTRDGAKSSVVMVKTGNAQGAIHIEVDVKSDSKKQSKRLLKSFLKHNNGGERKFSKKRDREHMNKDEKKRDFAKMLKRMIKKSELTQQQVTELKALLEEKNS
jgi:hypothetical protein